MRGYVAAGFALALLPRFSSFRSDDDAGLLHGISVQGRQKTTSLGMCLPTKSHRCVNHVIEETFLSLEPNFSKPRRQLPFARKGTSAHLVCLRFGSKQSVRSKNL